MSRSRTKGLSTNEKGILESTTTKRSARCVSCSCAFVILCELNKKSSELLICIKYKIYFKSQWKPISLKTELNNTHFWRFWDLSLLFWSICSTSIRMQHGHRFRIIFVVGLLFWRLNLCSIMPIRQTPQENRFCLDWNLHTIHYVTTHGLHAARKLMFAMATFIPRSFLSFRISIGHFYELCVHWIRIWRHRFIKGWALAGAGSKTVLDGSSEYFF